MEKYLHTKDFSIVDRSFDSMGLYPRTMFVVCFIKKILQPFVSNCATCKIGKGPGGMPNKGCFGSTFAINGRTINFIGGHLAPHENGKDKYERFIQRNRMIGEIVKDMNLNPLQKALKGIETDTLADISIMTGDFNYRMHSSIDAMQQRFASQKGMEEFFSHWHKEDELYLAMQKDKSVGQFSQKQLDWISKQDPINKIYCNNV